MTDTTKKPAAKRGFAAISKEQRTEIARLGGLAIPKEKRFFSKNPEAAKQIAKQPRKPKQ